MRARDLTALLEDHDVAVREFLDRASAVPSYRWHAPRAQGKWSPAQETQHIVRAFDAYLRDLRGEGTMRLKGKWWQRRLWRWVIMPRMLEGRWITRQVRAPREIRPEERPADKAPLLAELRHRVETFESTLVEARRVDPKRRVTHPFFGRIDLATLVRLSAAHTRHHARFLPDPQSPTAGPESVT
ncbi:MAG TPA: DinB family protein [Gemmatimonadaceae bacterium]|nr:DinB family protein [Gemmatimonadaceae bacterium]